MTTLQTAPPAAAPAPAPVGTTTFRRASLARLTQVELRKLADTRAGLWLLIVIGLASALTVVIQLFATDAEGQTFRAFFGFAQLPAGILLPVLGVLSMTSEWSQRTALTTFALNPARGRVIAAKMFAVVLIAILATAATGVIAAGGNMIGAAAGGDGSWQIPGQVVAQSLLLQVLFVLMGLGFGAVLQNSPMAIVAYFALPMVWSLLGALVSSLDRVAAWLDINTTSAVLTTDVLTGDQWAKLAVSAAVWVLVPLVAGTFRVLRREIN